MLETRYCSRSLPDRRILRMVNDSVENIPIGPKVAVVGALLKVAELLVGFKKTVFETVLRVLVLFFTCSLHNLHMNLHLWDWA